MPGRRPLKPGDGTWSPGSGVGPGTLGLDGQRIAAWLARRLQTWCPPVALVDETRFPIEGARRLVKVVMDPMGHRLEMRVAGFSTGRPDSPTGEWRGVAFVVTDGDGIHQRDL